MQLEPDQWRAHLRRFAQQECRGSSPLYEALALGLAQETELIEWMASVIGPRGHATLPFAAVHYVLLSGVNGEGLEAFYPNLADRPALHAQAYPVFRAFLVRERERLTPLLAARVTQTNEVGRCGYLLPALVLAAERAGKPLAIIDVGCSAGLNLLFDRYAIANEHPTVLAAAGFATAIQRSTEPPALPLVMSHFVRGSRVDRVSADVGPQGRWLNWFGDDETA